MLLLRCPAAFFAAADAPLLFAIAAPLRHADYAICLATPAMIFRVLRC